MPSNSLWGHIFIYYNLQFAELEYFRFLNSVVFVNNCPECGKKRQNCMVLFF